jgi:hypothetical protein
MVLKKKLQVAGHCEFHCQFFHSENLRNASRLADNQTPSPRVGNLPSDSLRLWAATVIGESQPSTETCIWLWSPQYDEFITVPWTHTSASVRPFDNRNFSGRMATW